MVMYKTNQTGDTCEAQKPDEDAEQFVIKQQVQIQQDQAQLEEKKEITEDIKDKIIEGTIDNVTIIHQDKNNTIFHILVTSIHNRNVFSVKFISYSENYLDSLFINDDGYYCNLTNCWSRNKDYQLLLQSETSSQIIETLAPLYSKHCKKLEMIKADHKAIQLECDVKSIDSAIRHNKLSVFLLDDQVLSIYEITLYQKIELQKQIQIGVSYNLLISKTKFLIYSSSKNIIIDLCLNVSEIQESIQIAYLKENIICYQTHNQIKQIEDNAEILENNIIQSEEVQTFRLLLMILINRTSILKKNSFTYILKLFLKALLKNQIKYNQ